MTPEQRSQLMSKIQGKDTAPELKVRKTLFAKGYRYRIHVKGTSRNARFGISGEEIGRIYPRMLLASTSSMQQEAKSATSKLRLLDHEVRAKP